MIRRLRALAASDGLRLVVLTIYYLGIAVALVALYGGNRSYTPPPFIYQGF